LHFKNYGQKNTMHTAENVGLQNSPKITVVTACFNQSRTIEQTIQSVVTQTYPNVEYILVDGQSTDSTMEIIGRYRDRIAKVVSEPDSGQYHAIGKGMAMSSGEVMSWLNGDDLYFPWTFHVVADVFRSFPGVDWIIGLPSFVSESGIMCEVSNRHPAYVRSHIAKGYYCDDLFGAMQQESMFWRRGLWDAVGGLDLTFRYAGDYELWTRFASKAQLVGVAIPLAAFRIDPTRQRSRVFQGRYAQEADMLFEKRAGSFGKCLARIGNKSFYAKLMTRFLAISRCQVVAKSIIRPEHFHLVSSWSNRNRKSFFGMLTEMRVRHHLSKPLQ
jgi:glycosyltransferase involved in cell wall biosynthesis